MKLYAIVSEHQAGKHGVDLSLERACAQKGLEYVRLIEEDITLDDLRTNYYEDESLLYRVSLSSKATAIEALLSRLYPTKFTTIYHQQVNVHPRMVLRELSEQMAAKLNIIPTQIVDETWNDMSEKEVAARLSELSGFPLVLKTLGKSHGEGVAKVDNLQALRSKLKSAEFESYNTILRKYLSDCRHYRCIVVDDEIVAAIEYYKPSNDFRTNASATPRVSAVNLRELGAGSKDMAIKGVKIRAAIIGGVDILVDNSTGEAYLAEVNVPCYYPRAEASTGIDIAGLIIDALQRKQAGLSRGR